MRSTSAVDKLRILLPHWAHHASEHADELMAWRAAAAGAGAEALEAYDQAISDMQAASNALQQVMSRLNEDMAAFPP